MWLLDLLLLLRYELGVQFTKFKLWIYRTLFFMLYVNDVVYKVYNDKNQNVTPLITKMFQNNIYSVIEICKYIDTSKVVLQISGKAEYEIGCNGMRTTIENDEIIYTKIRFNDLKSFIDKTLDGSEKVE